MNTVLSTHDLTIDVLTQQVKKNGQLLNLPHLSFKTLEVLVKNFPDSVTFDQLMDEVWQDVEVTQETVTQRMALLRKSLAKDASEGDAYIASVRSVGYRWQHEVSEHVAQTEKPKNFLWAFALAILTFLGWWVLGHYSSDGIKATVPLVSIDSKYNSQAWRYLRKHDFKSNQLATGLFRKALDVNPEDVDAMVGLSLALSHQVSKYNQTDELLTEAESLAEAATKLAPNRSDVWSTLAFVYDAQGYIEKAIINYEKAIDRDSNSSSAISSLAYLYTLKGRLGEALRFNISQVNSAAPYVDLQIAHTLELLGFDRVAEKWYEKADELTPDSVFATQQRARFFIATGLLQRAKELTEAALNRKVERPELAVNLGIISWIKAGLDESVRQHFRQAVLIDPSHFEANLWAFLSQTNQTTEERAAFESRWFQNALNWPDQGAFMALYHAHFNEVETAVSHLKTAYEAGYRNHRWLKALPPMQTLLMNQEFAAILQKMQQDVDRQRSNVVKADWLPTSFLDPQSY